MSFRDGYEFGLGFALASLFVGFVASGVGALIILGAFGQDDMLTIRTDAGTGCQYLRSLGDTALTPRLDASGKQICGVPK